MDKVCFTLPTMEQVLFSVIPEEEEESPEVSISRYENDSIRIKEFIDAVNNNLAHSPFGWCFIRVVATWKGVEGGDGLGACSYKSLEEFVGGGYYEQMRDDAYNDLLTELRKLSD